jgi:hypothetical protein
MKVNSLLNALGRFVSEAGSEQSPNSRWGDSDSFIAFLFVGGI